jgi:hypothetical protein
MSYSEIPTRSSTDTNASADINQLQDNVQYSQKLRNIIVNSNFSINQDGANPVTGLTTNTYYIDEHESVISGVTGNSSVETSSQPSALFGTSSYKHAATSTASGTLGYRTKIEEFANYRGETIHASIYVKSNSTNARVIIDDADSTSSSTAHTGGGGWERLEVTHTVSASAARIHVYTIISSSSIGSVSISSGDYVEGTGEQLIPGSYAVDYAPRGVGLAEERALCQRYFLIYNGGAGAGSLGIGAYNTTTNLNVDVFLPVPMRANPTLTYSAADAIVSIVAGSSLNSSAIALQAVSATNISNALVEINVTTAATTAGNAALIRLDSNDWIKLDSRL